jgi:5-hydroxyisourate hydrolase-like protein (transthyretin family)
MKNRILTQYVAKRISLFFSALIFTQFIAFAQSDTSASIIKKQVTLKLNFNAKSDSERTVVVSAIERHENGKPALAENLKINIYSFKDGTPELLLEVTTNEKGKSTIQLSSQLEEDVQGTIHLIAKVENNPDYEDAEIEGSTKKGRIIIATKEADSTKTVTATLLGFGKDGNPIPIADVDLIFYVQRLFGVLPLGDDATVTTDKNGMASLVFPQKINGDKTGNVILVAKVENNETYGTVSASTQAQFGEPVNPESDTSSALWKSQAPLWMSLSFFLALTAILTTVSYLIYQLYKIKKESSL